MVERLQRLADTLTPSRSPYVNAAQVDAMVKSGPPADTRGRFLFKYNLAQHRLHAGQVADAIDDLRNMQDEVTAHNARAGRRERVPDQFIAAVERQLAVSYLTLARLDNCVEDRGTPACLMPIDQAGVHRRETPTRTARDLYETILRGRADDLGARWLVNVTRMMLAEYPDQVPEEWLIPPSAFESQYEIQRFPDIAPALHVDVIGRLGGAIMDDFDNDGYLDVIASAWGLRDQLRYFRNTGDGTFSDQTVAAGLFGLGGGINLTQADYNNDGCLDALVIRGAWSLDGEPNSLLRNNCDGTFEDVAAGAGLAEDTPTLSASWGDFNNDGWIDLFVANEARDDQWLDRVLPAGASRPRRVASQLYQNNGDGTFTDVASETGAAVLGFNKGVVWGDYDRDGRLDLYVSRLGETNVLLHNDGPDQEGIWQFRDVTAAAGVAAPIESFPTWFWDYDNDGWLDIFVSGYRTELADIAAEYLERPHRAALPRLYRNNRNGGFTDVSEVVRLDKIMYTMGANFGDLDNDGWLDFYAGTGDVFFEALMPNRMFRNADGTTFQDVTTAGGFGHLLKGHGVAFGDLDNDGDQDIYVTMGGAYEGDLARNVLFENPGHGNQWITLVLEGTRSNRAAIGAHVHIAVDTPTGQRDIHRTVSSGGSFGANSLQQEIGLANATAIRNTTITWPGTGATDTYSKLELNRVYRIREGEPLASPVSVERVALPSGDRR